MESSVLVLLLVVASCQAEVCLDEENKNENFTDCLSCLVSKAPACGWCLQVDDTSLGLGACLTNGSTCKLWYEETMDDDKGDSSSSTDSIRIYSSNLKTIQFKLRPNKERTIEIEAKKKDNPVDMYFLLDLTRSMKNVKENLAEITDGLMDVRILSNYKFTNLFFFTVQDLGETTKQCKFGYGVFREKPTVPMSAVFTDKSVPSFEHLLPLTPNKEEVKRFIINRYINLIIPSLKHFLEL